MLFGCLKIAIKYNLSSQEPITYLQATQESANGTWHMPYQEFKEPGSWSKPDSSPDKWMCIKMQTELYYIYLNFVTVMIDKYIYIFSKLFADF